MSAKQRGQEISGYITLQGDPTYPVFAGQAFALLEPVPGEGSPEFDNKEKKQQGEKERFVQVSSSSCVYQAQSGELLARGYGLVQVKDHRMQVVPLMRVSKDRLHLLATIYSWDFFAQEITLQRIEQAVQDLGLEVELEEEKIMQALEAARKSDSPQKGIVVAKGGCRPQEARDAQLELAGDSSLPVFPGYALGRILQAQECIWGKSIDGTPLEPEKKDPPLRIEPWQRCGWTLGQDSETIYATRYGLLTEAQGQPFVSSLITISKDRLYVWATLFAKDFYHKKVSVRGMMDLFQAAGMKAELDERAIAAALKQSKKDKAAQEKVLVASGRPPEQGHDGRVIFAWEEEEKQDVQNGRLDPRQRSLYKSVKQDQLICWLEPPGAGKPGIDVFGKEVASKPGYQAQVIVGQNVAAYKNDKPLAVQSQEPLKSGQGQEKNTDESPRNLQGQVVTEPGVEFRALLPGVVGWNGKTISVLEAIQIKGDVDYSTGNIEFKKGSVHVQGSIKSGFSLKTPGNVYVKQSVEGAVLQAGGDCVVNIGLSMQEKGSVTVGGSLQAHFMENATVKAKGDIFITHDIINSLIQTLGQVQATKGRGKIQGGLIRAATGVQCNVLGSERGVSTRIVLSFVAEGDPALIQRRDQLKRKLQKIQEVLGEDNYQTLLEKTPKEKHPQLVEMLKNKSKILAELKELKPKIKESKQELTQRTMESKIVVKDKVYPGVEITIAQESLEVKETLHSPTFYLDQESMAIKIA